MSERASERTSERSETVRANEGTDRRVAQHVWTLGRSIVTMSCSNVFPVIPGGGLGLAGETVFLFSDGASRVSGVDPPLPGSSFDGKSWRTKEMPCR